MTDDRRAKRVVRARMAQTGEKYTDARRALLGDGRPPGAGAVAPAEDAQADWLVGRFTDQAYNAILLAQDEARMLGRWTVEPEHLLLAVARSGNVHRLLQAPGVAAGAIHAAVVRRGGLGPDLVLGPVPRSPEGEAVLRRAVGAAAERGVRGPSSEHVLLGLAPHDLVAEILRELGIPDAVALVDARYPATRPPLDTDAEWRAALAAGPRRPPSPGPVPPVFERYTAAGRLAVDEAVRIANALENGQVTPTHLLLGAAEHGAVATVRGRHAREFDALSERAMEVLAARSSQATGIFAAAARRIVAEHALAVAHRLGHRSIGTGHLFLALAESPDEAVDSLFGALGDAPGIGREIASALPDELGYSSAR